MGDDEEKAMGAVHTVKDVGSYITPRRNEIMNTDPIQNLLSQLKLKTEEIVKRGGDVRAEVSRLVSEGAGKLHQTTDGLVSLVKAVTEGATAGAGQALPDQAESALRSVINGLADGLTKAAEAVSLTLKESGANGTRFAKEDLDKIAKDFRAMSGSFVETVTAAAGKVGGHVSEQARTIGGHALQTFQSAWPSVEAAIVTAVQSPVQIGKEAVHAGASAAQQAAGVLFTELGKHLQSAGDRLRH
jgi:uncharacterized protein YukE